MKTQIWAIAGAVAVLTTAGTVVWRATARSRDEAAARKQTAHAYENIARAGADPQELRVALDLYSMVGKGYRLSDEEWERLAKIASEGARKQLGTTPAILAFGAISTDLEHSPERSEKGFDLAAEILDDASTQHSESVDSSLLQVLLATRSAHAAEYFKRFEADSRRNVRNVVLTYQKGSKSGKAG